MNANASGDAKQSKNDVRSEARAYRNALSPENRRVKSAEICRMIDRSGLLDRAHTVMVYAAVRGEVDLTPLIEGLLSQACIVTFPVIDGERKTLTPVAIGSMRELKPGAFGIPAPPPSALRLDPTDLDAVVVPGLAFDRDGYRVGYGGGYYDRFLPKIQANAVRIGVVYHDLLRPTVPREAFDQQVDWVVTEREAVGPFRT